MIDSVLNIRMAENNGYLKRIPEMKIGIEKKVNINYMSKCDVDITIEALSLVNQSVDKISKILETMVKRGSLKKIKQDNTSYIYKIMK